MFSFKKDETTKLIELSVQDHKAWEAAKARLEKAKSAWQTLQAEIELLCARSASFSGTASHDMHEPWWRLP